MGLFRYSRPDESFIGAASTGTVDADFNALSLCDGRPGDAVKRTGGLSLTAYATGRVPVGVVAVCNHDLSSGGRAEIVFAGSTTTVNVDSSGLPANDIPLNAYALLTETCSSGLTITTTGAVLGELWAGRVRTLERGLMVDSNLLPPDPYQWAGTFGSIPPNDEGVEARRLSGTAIVSDTGLADIEEWYRATRRGVYPSLIIPFDGVPDAWLVTFGYSVVVTWKHPTLPSKSIYKVAFEFTEMPRTRW